MAGSGLAGDASGGGWPELARERHRDAVLAGVRERPARLQLIVGEAGAGKSSLAAAVARAEGGGHLLVVGSWERSGIPLGAFADVLGSAPDDDPVAHAVTTLGATSGLLVVDDAPRLDDLSAEVLRRLVRGLGRPVVATSRRGEELPAPLRELDAEGLVRRHALDGLTADETARLLELRFRVPAREESVSRLVWRTDGNPLHLRMIVEDAIETGDVIHRGDAVEFRAPDRATELAAALARRIATLSPAARELLALVVLTEPAPRSALLANPGRDAALDELAGRGMLAPVDHDGLRVAHPLIAESDALSSVLTEVRAEAARLLRASGEPARRYAAVALELRAGLESPLDELVWAAGHAAARGDHRSAARLADAAVRRPASRARAFTAHLTAAAQHSLAGDLDDADRLFVDAAALARESSELALLAGARGDHLAHRRGDPASAIAQAEEVREALTAEEAVALDADLWRWRSSAAAVGAGAAAEFGGAIAATVAAAMRGEPDAARSSAAPLLAARDSLGPLRPTAEIALGVQRLVELRSRRPADDAVAFLEAGRAAAGDEVGFFTLMLASLRMQAGLLDAAAELADLALEQFDRWDGGELGSLAIALRATVDARLGRAEDARARLAVLDGREVSGAAVLQRAECRAFLAAADGDEALPATSILAVVEDAAASGYRFFGALTLAEALRFGETTRASRLARELCAGMAEHSEPAEAIRDLAEALDDRAPERVADAARRVARAGLAPVAVDALAQALEFPARGEVRRRLQVLASELATGIQGLVVSRRSEPGLTPRELEVATAAANRLRGREIAARLGISARTVENQLYSAYRKLGVGSRDELRAALVAAGLLEDPTSDPG